MDNLSELFLTENLTVNYITFLKSFITALVLSFILSRVYLKYSDSFSDKNQFSNSIIIISLIITLIITIIKSSLALSLGLVGALSIVRFRTAVKETEDLTFMFLGIGIGLGCGANMLKITILSFIIIIAVIILFKNGKIKNYQKYFLSIHFKNDLKNYEDLEKLFIDNKILYKLNKLDLSDESNEIIFEVKIKNISDLDKITKIIKESIPQSQISYFNDFF